MRGSTGIGASAAPPRRVMNWRCLIELCLNAMNMPVDDPGQQPSITGCDVRGHDKIHRPGVGGRSSATPIGSGQDCPRNLGSALPNPRPRYSRFLPSRCGETELTLCTGSQRWLASS